MNKILISRSNSCNAIRISQRFMTQSNISIEKEIILYGGKKQTPVSLKSLMDTGRGDLLHAYDPKSGRYLGESSASDRVLFQVASFLHRELPVRIANRVEHLQSTPYFRRSASIQRVCSRYKNSFARLRAAAAPTNPEKRQEFTKLLESVYDVHSSTLIYIAKGLQEIRHSMAHSRDDFADMGDIQKVFDEFFLSRIGIRMLVAQYLKLCKPQTDSNLVGLINLKTSPYDIATAAIADASFMCRRQHGDAPDVVIVGRTDLTFPYVPSHLNYVLVELLKNSMRATVETHGVDNMPPIKIVIADGEDNEDVVIKVSDEGGGIKRSNMKRIWSYLYTTADPSALESMLMEVADPNDTAIQKEVAGLIVGEYASRSEVSNSSSDNKGDASIGGTTDSTAMCSNTPVLHSPLRDFATASPLAGLGYGLPIARNYARYFGGDLVIMSMEGYGTDGYIYLPRLGNTDASV